MIDSILDFYFNAKRYKGLAESPVDTRVLESNIKKVRLKADEIAEIGIESDSVDKAEILKRVAEDYKRGVKPSETNYNRKELKCLSYNIGVDPNPEYLSFCLELLVNSWSESFLRGLLHSLLIHWGTLDDGGRKLIISFFQNIVESSSSRYATKLKPVLKYLDNGGAYKLGNKARSEKKEIFDICQVFGIPNNRISYSYFSDAIIAYYESIGRDEFPHLKDILLQHNNTRTSKVIISKLIIRSQTEKTYQQQIMDFALEMIGDPTLASKWAPFPKATREEEKNLETARRILLKLYAERAIDTFFKYLCVDPRRQKFWKRYSSKIINFTVYGSQESKNYIAPYINLNFLNSHFKSVTSRNITCGLVMYLGDYAIIEFSDTGALYAYRRDSSHYNLVFSGANHISKIDDLKLPYLPSLASVDNRYGYTALESEGRLIHSGRWENRMAYWIERYIK